MEVMKDSDPLESSELGFLRMSDLLRLIPVSLATLKRWMRDGRFPRGVLVSRGVRLWSVEDVNAWRARLRHPSHKE
jgi:predicted DNA-binding transcriptional regulator AlpA